MTTADDGDLDGVLAALLDKHPHPLRGDVNLHVALHPRYEAQIRAFAGEVLTTAIEGGGIFGVQPDTKELEAFRTRAAMRGAGTKTNDPYRPAKEDLALMVRRRREKGAPPKPARPKFSKDH